MNENATQFGKRTEFYKQFTAVYAVALSVYIVLKGLIVDNGFADIWGDPFAILLATFSIGSACALLVQLAKRHVIIIEDEAIVFKTRTKTKRFKSDSIIRIIARKERISGIAQRYRLFKIKVDGRKRMIRIRPSSFFDDTLFVEKLLQLKSKIDARHNRKHH